MVRPECCRFISCLCPAHPDFFHTPAEDPDASENIEMTVSEAGNTLTVEVTLDVPILVDLAELPWYGRVWIVGESGWEDAPVNDRISPDKYSESLTFLSFFSFFFLFFTSILFAVLKIFFKKLYFSI